VLLFSTIAWTNRPTSMRAYIEIAALVFVAFVIFIAVAAFVSDLRRPKRKGVSREEFVRGFALDGVPEEISEAVYRFLTRSWFWASLTVAPDDSLLDVLDMGEEGVQEAAPLLLRTLRLEPPSEEARLQWMDEVRALRQKGAERSYPFPSSQWTQPIQTVGELVLWLDWVRQHQNPAQSCCRKQRA
jgi:hypothetical protein